VVVYVEGNYRIVRGAGVMLEENVLEFTDPSEYV
jgi:hypothetical protein